MTTAVISWTNPTTHSDNSQMPLGEVAAIQIWDIHDGAQPVMIGSFGNPNGVTLNFTTPQLAAGVHVFYTVTQDVAGNLSENSQSVTVTVARPSPPSGVGVSINP